MNTVLITGAGSGIGAATARKFSENGYFVYLVGRNLEKLKTTATQLPNKNSCLQCDIRHLNEVQKLTDQLSQELGSQGLDTLINNAGIFDRRSFYESEDAFWEKHFQANFMGSVRMTRELIPILQHSPRANIVNISSTLGLKPVIDTSVYSSMKAAMLSWTQCLALELAPKIRVNAICPGLVDTPIHSFHNEDDTSELRRQVHQMQPMQRMGQSYEVAEAVFFLASEFSSWTTGSLLTVDGGIHLL